jgi:PKD repeat protein
VADDHPISWCQRYEGGRSWYTGMGHTAATFSEPLFLEHLLGGIEVAAGAAGSDECGVEERGNGAPTVRAAADPDTGRAPLTIRFSAAGSDPDGDALTYEWEFGDGQRSFRPHPTHEYLQPGTYMATVTVTDPDGATGSAAVEVIVTNPPGNVAPTVRAAADPSSGRAPLRVQFSAAGSDPDGDQLTYAWDFGDGGIAYGPAAIHTYERRGTYDARVTVTDARGATASATVRVQVTRGSGVAGESAGRPGLRVRSTHDVERVIQEGLRYRVSCEALCRVTSVLRVKGGDRQALGRSSARRVGAGKSRQMVLRLDRGVRRNLLAAMREAKLRRLRTTLVVTVTTSEGTTTLRRQVTLTR